MIESVVYILIKNAIMLFLFPRIKNVKSDNKFITYFINIV
jgi:hypothetical protein